MNYMLEQTQNHIHFLGLESPDLGPDQRHKENMKYPFLDYDILTEEAPGKLYFVHWSVYVDVSSATSGNPIYQADATENIGLCHDIQCWYGQAHQVCFSVESRGYDLILSTQKVNPVPSVQLRGGGSGDAARTARSYILATGQQSKYLSMMLKKFAPAEYELLKKSADAGRWYTDTEESCTLGLATVWKLQVGLHNDPHDWELCLIVCGGKFNGGRLYLPDLNLCLA